MGGKSFTLGRMLAFTTFVVAAFVFFPSTLTAAIGDARINYGQGVSATPQTRFYTNSLNTFGAAGATVAGTANVGWVVSKESPTEDVTVMATQSTTGMLDVYCRNGGTWTKDWSVSVGTSAASRRFDVAFEKTSGVTMILYSTNATPANEMAYRRKTGAGCGVGAWSVATNLDSARMLIAVDWIELVARNTAGTNVIAAGFMDFSGCCGGALSAMIWNGSSWGNEPAAVLDLNVAYQSGSTANGAKSFDLAFESLSGDLIIGWGNSSGNNGTNGFRYATCAAALPCTWSAVQTPAGLLDDATDVNAAPDPSSDAVAFASIGTAGSDLQAWLWSGSAVGAVIANADTSAVGPNPSYTLVDVGWVVNGARRMAVVTYADNPNGYHYIYYDTAGATWRTNANAGFAIPGSPNTTGRHIQMTTNPANTTQVMASFVDNASDLWSKRLAYNGAGGGPATALSTWSNSDAGVALETTVSSITAKSFWYDWIKVNTLVIGASAGTKVANLNSGDTAQYMQSTACATPATCSVFTITPSGAETLNSIKLTQTGTANSADLANVALFYDTDGNYSNGVTGQYGATVANFTGNTVTISGALAMTAGTTYYFYVRNNLLNGANNPKGGQTINYQIAANGDVVTSGGSVKSGAPATLSGVTTVRPQITGYTNTTESGLNYAAACSGCGARIGGGAGFRQTLTISGYGFGSDPGLGSRSSATNKVEVVGAATTAFVDDASVNTNVSAWASSTITVRTDSSIAGNTDASWGANYGGALGLRVTANGVAVPLNLNFYVFPQVTSVTQPAGLPADTAREYNALDTDGVVTLNGTRFGTAQGTGYVRILGCDSVTCAAPASSVVVNSWSTTAIQVQVPPVIADNVYTGSILMAQGTGGNSKTHTYGNTFRILPRITSFTPASGSANDAVVANGNHLCENAAVCPVAFNASNKVTFTSAVDATVFTTWTNTAMTTEVPVGAATGAVVLKSNTYDSNGLSFTVVSSLPNDPTALNQFQNAGLTQAIAVGGGASSTPVRFTMTMQAVAPGGTLFPQLEYKPIGSAFTCGVGVCATAVEGTGVAGPGPTDCAVVANGCAIAISPTDNIYHWRARVRRNKSGTDYFSNWVSFPTSGNAETITDLAVDTIAPAITNINGGIPGTNSTTVTWDTSGEVSTSQVQYNITGTFVNNCAVNNDCTPLDVTAVLNHSVAIANLDSGTTYFFRVRSKDAAGNETISANNTFVTSSVTQPAKTVRFHAGTFANGVVLGGSATSTTFAVAIPEVATTTKSAYLVLRAIYSTTGTAPNGIAIQVNTEPSVTYQLPGVSSTGNIRLVHPVAQLRVGTATNTISVSPEINTSLNIISSDVFVTYSYTP